MATAKIVLIGPESTGKSTLTRELAEHFNAPFVAEFAREYLENRTELSYEFHDLEHIARQQLAVTQKALAAKPNLLFCDTDLVTLHIWALDKFDKSIPFVEANLISQKADLYLLCKPDLAWQPDPLREDSNRREELYNWNLWLLRELNAQFVEVEGQQKQRVNHAVAAIKKFLAK
jgi:NadR type nicotinamide-nucleotide adenylyltransferase